MTKTNNSKNSLSQNFVILITFFLTIFLLNNEFIKYFVWQLPDLFMDMKQGVAWLKCHSLGFDIYNNIEPCYHQRMNYGKILLLFPYNEIFEKFYSVYFPYLLIFLSIFLIQRIIRPTSTFEYFLFFLCIFNPSTILLFERANLDMLVFVLLILIIKNKINFINWTLYFFLSFLKIYPVVILINFFLEDKSRSLKNLFIYCFLFCLISLCYLFFNFEEYAFIMESSREGKPGYHFLYSLNSLAKIIKYIFGINYILLLILTYSLFIFLSIKIYQFLIKEKIFLKENFFTNEHIKLFLVGGYISCFLFFTVSNFFYKEIFLICLIPYYLNNIKMTNNKIFKLIIKLILLRYIFLFIYSYFNVNDGLAIIDNQRIFSNAFLTAISIKGLIDFIFMSIVLSFLIYETINIFNFYFAKYKSLD